MLAHIRFQNTEVGHWNELGWLGDHSLAASRYQHQALAHEKAGRNRQLRQSIQVGEPLLTALDETDLIPDVEDAPPPTWSAA